MIYLDTSWLVKLYVAEPDAGPVRELVARDDAPIVSDIAYVEFHAAVARRRRDAKLTSREAATLVARFRREWTDRTRVGVSREVLTLAADLLERHPLRSLDAIQLASALVVAAGAPEPPRLGAADSRLRAAARAEGLVLAG